MSWRPPSGLTGNTVGPGQVGERGEGLVSEVLDRRGPGHQAGQVDQGGGEEAEVEEGGGGREDGAGRGGEQLERSERRGEKVVGQPGMD